MNSINREIEKYNKFLGTLSAPKNSTILESIKTNVSKIMLEGPYDLHTPTTTKPNKTINNQQKVDPTANAEGVEKRKESDSVSAQTKKYLDQCFVLIEKLANIDSASAYYAEQIAVPNLLKTLAPLSAKEKATVASLTESVDIK